MKNIFTFALFALTSFCFTDFAQAQDEEETRVKKVQIGLAVGVGATSNNSMVANSMGFTTTSFAVNYRLDLRVNFHENWFFQTAINATNMVNGVQGNTDFYRLPILFGKTFHLSSAGHFFIAPVFGLEFGMQSFTDLAKNTAFAGFSNTVLAGTKLTFFINEKHKISMLPYFGVGVLSSDKSYIQSINYSSTSLNSLYLVLNLLIEYVYRVNEGIGIKAFVANDLRTTIATNAKEVNNTMQVVDSSNSTRLFNMFSVGVGVDFVF